MRRVLLVSCMALFAYSAAIAGQEATIAQKLSSLEGREGRFAFAVIGDNRSGDDIYGKLVRMIMDRRPDFVVNVGDLIRRPGSLSGWKGFWELSAPLSVPYFLAVGNHDVSDKESEEIYKEQVDLPGKELYYSFSCGNSLFIVLDSSLVGENKKITGEQFDWLQKLLETANKRHKFLFVHHPLFPDRLSLSGNLGSHSQERDRLLGLLVRHKVQAVFAGHLHLYQRKDSNGLTQIITGGGGAPLIADEESGGFFHFLLVTVDNDTVSVEVIDLDGKVRERFALDQP